MKAATFDSGAVVNTKIFNLDGNQSDYQEELTTPDRAVESGQAARIRTGT